MQALIVAAILIIGLLIWLLFAGLGWLLDALQTLFSKKNPSEGKTHQQQISLKPRRSNLYNVLADKTFKNAEANAARLNLYVVPPSKHSPAEQQRWSNRFDELVKRKVASSIEVLLTDIVALQKSKPVSLVAELEYRRSAIRKFLMKYPVVKPTPMKIPAPEMPVFVTNEDIDGLCEKYGLSDEERTKAIGHADTLNKLVETALENARTRHDAAVLLEIPRIEELIVQWEVAKNKWG